MVNLLVIPQKIVVVFYYMIDLLRLFQKRSFVLSSEHENQNVATIGTLLDQLMLRCNFFFFFLIFFNFFFIYSILQIPRLTSIILVQRIKKGD